MILIEPGIVDRNARRDERMNNSDKGSFLIIRTYRAFRYPEYPSTWRKAETEN